MSQTHTGKKTSKETILQTILHYTCKYLGARKKKAWFYSTNQSACGGWGKILEEASVPINNEKPNSRMPDLIQSTGI